MGSVLETEIQHLRVWLFFSYEFAGKINETYIEPTGRIVIANVDIAKDSFILVNVYSPTQNEHNS